MFHRTARLFLRPAWPEDWEAVLGGIADEGVVRNLARAPWPYGPEEARAFAALPQNPCRPHFLVTEAASGRLVETMACGTAAVVTPVGTVLDPEGGEFTIGGGGTGQVTAKMRDMLTGIQTGKRPDPHGWVVRV